MNKVYANIVLLTLSFILMHLHIHFLFYVSHGRLELVINSKLPFFKVAHMDFEDIFVIYGAYEIIKL